jgi:hypothetical protein
MMSRSVLLLFTATLAGFLAGCGQGPDPDQPNPDAAPGRVVIPDPGEVSAVVIGVHGGPGNESRFPGAPFELRLADRADVAEVLGWLKQVDWSREGMDLTAVRLAVAGSIEIVRREGPALSFLFTWDGVIHKNQLRRVDTTRLTEVIRRNRGK